MNKRPLALLLLLALAVRAAAQGTPAPVSYFMRPVVRSTNAAEARLRLGIDTNTPALNGNLTNLTAWGATTGYTGTLFRGLSTGVYGWVDSTNTVWNFSAGDGSYGIELNPFTGDIQTMGGLRDAYGVLVGDVSNHTWYGSVVSATTVRAPKYAVTGSGSTLATILNVKEAPYNALGDGTNDDTTALQTALNAADGVTNSKVVYLPGGIYKISSPLYFTHPGTILRGVINTNNPSYLGALQGGLYNSEIIQSTAGDVLIITNGLNICRIESLMLFGNGLGASTGACLRATGAGGNVLSDFSLAGVVLGQAQYGLYLDTLWNSTFDHVTFYALGACATGVNDCRDIHFLTCNADENVSGFAVTAGPWLFENCQMGMGHRTNYLDAATTRFQTNDIVATGLGMVQANSCRFRIDGATNGAVQLSGTSQGIFQNCYIRDDNGTAKDYFATLWGTANYLEVASPQWQVLSTHAIAVTTNSLAQRVYASPDPLNVDVWNGQTVSSTFDSSSRFRPSISYLWTADQTLASANALLVGPPLNAYGGSIYWRGNYRNWMARAEDYSQGNFALSVSTNNTTDPVVPIFFVNATNNATTIGHSVPNSWPGYTNTLTVEGTLNTLGTITQNGVPVSTGGADNTINVTQAPYNAVGNGTTDCTVALQTALNDGLTLGKTVYVPQGTYHITNTLVMDGAVSQKGITVIGDGRNRTMIHQVTPGAGGILITNGLDDVSLAFLHFYGPATNWFGQGATGVGISASDSGGTGYINMCHVLGCEADLFGVGILGHNSASMVIAGGNVQSNGIGIHLSGNAAPVEVSSQGNVFNVTNVWASDVNLQMSGCDLGPRSNGVYTISVQGTFTENNFEIAGGWAAVTADNYSKLSFVNNRFVDASGGAVGTYTFTLTNSSAGIYTTVDARGQAFPMLAPSLTATNPNVQVKMQSASCLFTTDAGNVGVTTPYGDFTAGTFWSETANSGKYGDNTTALFSGIPWRYMQTNSDEVLAYKYRKANGTFQNVDLLAYAKGTPGNNYALTTSSNNWTADQGMGYGTRWWLAPGYSANEGGIGWASTPSQTNSRSWSARNDDTALGDWSLNVSSVAGGAPTNPIIRVSPTQQTSVTNLLLTVAGTAGAPVSNTPTAWVPVQWNGTNGYFAWYYSSNQPAPASYTANAVTYDGVTSFLTRTNGFGAITNSQKGTLSFWVKFAGNETLRQRVLDLPYFRVSRLESAYAGVFQAYGVETDGLTGCLDLRSSATYTNAGVWYHVWASWDLTATNLSLLVNGSSVSNIVTALNANIYYAAAADAHVGVETGSTYFLDGCLAEVWFATEYLPASYVTSFESGGKPVSLGNGVVGGIAPVLYLKGAYTAPGVNSGTGGDLTATGTFTSCTAP